MNSASKIVAFVLSLFMIAYVAYQSYQFFYNPYETEVVLKEQYMEDLELSGFFVRDEAAFAEPKQGVIGYPYKNAEKVAKGAVVANLYNSEEDLYKLQEADELTALKEILSKSQDSTQLQGVKLDLLVKQIAESKAELVKCVDENDFTDLKNIYLTLMSRMDQFNAYIDSSVSYEAMIASLDAQINVLRSSVSTTGESISSAESGYFSNVVDGYEMIFTPDILTDLTIAKAEELMDQKVSSVPNSIGKITRDANWSFVSVVTAKQAESFSKGNTIKLHFHSLSTGEVSATVSQVITEKGNDKAVVIFTGNFLNDDFVNMRFEKPTVVVKNYTGIIIPKEAVRIRSVEDSEGNLSDVKGVYVMVGTMVRFKQLEPIYEDDHVVVSKIVSNSNYVAIYDQVIIRGKDLDDAAG